MHRLFQSFLAIAAACLASASVLAAESQSAPPPTPAVQPTLYDTQAEASRDIAIALRKARRDHSRVLLQYGGNWSAKCHELERLINSHKELADELRNHYIRVLVDYGQPRGKNSALVAQYNADPHNDGVPYFTILDLSGRMFANQPLAMFQRKTQPKHDVNAPVDFDPDAIVKFLKANRAPAVTAQAVLDKGLAEARSSGRRVFLHFGAPWCIWCHRLDDWLMRPDVAPILAKDFIDIKIDQDRFAGGKAMLQRFLGDRKEDGIPWCIVLDAEGKSIADSSEGGGNIGFPASEDEIARFAAMLKKAAAKIIPAEIDTLAATLKPATPQKPAPETPR